MTKNENHMPTLRVLRVLEAIAGSPEGMTFSEIVESTGLPKSSLFPIVHTLVSEEYLHYSKMFSRYTLNVKTLEIGNRFLNQFNFTDYVRQQMHSIVSICNETCHFAILSQTDVLYIDKVDSTNPIRMYSSIGKRMPAYGTALGKALLCCHSLADLQKLYPNGLEPLTPNTITDINVLAEQLKKVREQGVAYEKEESNEHVQCIAVPIFKDSRPVLALSVAVPVFRAAPDKLELIEKLLVGAKSNIEHITSVKNIPFDSLF